MSREINELEPETRERCVKLLQRCAAEKHPVIVVQTFRSFEEQEALYAKGRVRPGPVVTNARGGDSWHNFRRAFDVVFLRGSQITWDGPWSKVGEFGEELGLVWGGRFTKLADRPHFEFHPVLTLVQAQAQSMVVRADITDDLRNV